MKLAMLAFADSPPRHPGATGIAPYRPGARSRSATGPPGCHKILYELSSSAATRLGLRGPQRTPAASPTTSTRPTPFTWTAHWPVHQCLNLRFVPIHCPIRPGGQPGSEETNAFTTGTLRSRYAQRSPSCDRACADRRAPVMPVAVLGPVAEHLGPCRLKDNDEGPHGALAGLALSRKRLQYLAGENHASEIVESRAAEAGS